MKEYSFGYRWQLLNRNPLYTCKCKIRCQELIEAKKWSKARVNWHLASPRMMLLLCNCWTGLKKTFQKKTFSGLNVSTLLNFFCTDNTKTHFSLVCPCCVISEFVHVCLCQCSHYGYCLATHIHRKKMSLPEIILKSRLLYGVTFQCFYLGLLS